MNKFRFALATAATLAALPTAFAAPTVAPTPYAPLYGQPVSIAISNAEWPMYLPATRYSRNGSHLDIDFETLGNNFNIGSSAFGYKAVPVGELPAGNYTVTARIHDLARPQEAPQVVHSTFGVVPPDSWGVYTVPKQPQAFEATKVMIRSAAFFDASSMRTSVAGNVVRVDFDYGAGATVSRAAPAGLTTFAAVDAGTLAPGSWRVEAWGRPIGGGESKLYFTKDLVIGGGVTVHEFYEPTLDHYFITAGPEEVAKLDGGHSGAWKRTGHGFGAWLRAEDAPAAARPVCRFYAAGPNSHFYTGDAGECATLKELERSGRAQANAQNTRFFGWTYEGIAFYAIVPERGACPAGTNVVYRSYNNRATQNDSNHRFTADPQLRSAMSWSWTDEGAAFCSTR